MCYPSRAGRTKSVNVVMLTMDVDRPSNQELLERSEVLIDLLVLDMSRGSARFSVWM